MGERARKEKVDVDGNEQEHQRDSIYLTNWLTVNISSRKALGFSVMFFFPIKVSFYFKAGYDIIFLYI